MLLALYDQAPFAFWLVVAALFLSIDLAAGTGLLIWAVLGAIVMGLLGLTGWRLGAMGDLVVFCAIFALGVSLALGKLTVPSGLAAFHSRVVLAFPNIALRDPDVADRKARSVLSNDDDDAPSSSGHIIGRIARTTCPFVGGVGRVWIDGLEWTAEVDSGEDLDSDAPVRVMAVVGEDRLHVACLPG